MPSRITIEQKVEHVTLKQPLPRSAFKSTGLYRVELPAEMSLYKLTHAGAVDRDSEVAVDRAGWITPWWFSYESLFVSDSRHGAVTVRGVADVVANASRAQAGFREFLRTRGAVCVNWNVMTHLLLVELRRPVIALMGTCSGQPFYDEVALQVKHNAENISFIGGEQQFYVPGLRRTDVTVLKFGKVG